MDGSFSRREFDLLPRRISEKFRGILRLMRRDAIKVQGIIIPAKHLRYGGSLFKDNLFFLQSAKDEADRLIKNFDMTTEDCVLDLGCGVGRLAIGILELLGNIRGYSGVDIGEKSIQWCKKYIATRTPNFEFYHLNLFNQRYNPKGQRIDNDFQFPFPKQKFDIIYLYSVFSHMIIDDIKTYLKEFYRMLKQNGGVFLTAFVEDQVINPVNYRRQWQGKLHCVRYDKNYFESVLQKRGFCVDKFEYGQETDGQSAYYLSKLK